LVAASLMYGASSSTPARSAKLRRPIALALVSGGKRLLVANRDNGSISILDSEQGRVLSEITVGVRLSHLTASAAGDRVLVTDEHAGELIGFEYTNDNLRETSRVKIGQTPVSVRFSDNGRVAAVACLWPRQLILLDLAVSKRTILDLPFAPRCQLVIPGTGKLIVADSFGGKLALIDIENKKIESVRTLHVHNIRGLSLDRQGKSLLFTHQVLYRQGHPNSGDIRSGNLIANHVRRLSLMSVLNPLADLLRDEQLYTLGDVENGAGDPVEVAESFDGAILVTLGGTAELAVGQPEQAIWTRLPTEARPTALVVDEARRVAYVANTFADSISVIDLQSASVRSTIRLGDEAARTVDLSPEQRGEQLFYDARLSLDGWYSCHSCHSDGHTNGRLNDNLTDGSLGTPKRVLSLLGVKDTGPWAWSGQMTDLGKQVRHSLKSTMQGAEPGEQRVRDLVAYLHTLEPPPAVARARGELDAATVERGRVVFVSRKCALCHLGPALTTPRTYDVGLGDEGGITQFNPPSLRGLSQAGPFFHDSRALTLDEVLGRFRHRLPEELPDNEMHDLLTFLRSL